MARELAPEFVIDSTGAVAPEVQENVMRDLHGQTLLHELATRE